MKLRLQENAIRFRLAEAEVERLRSGSPLQERICFPGGCLEFHLDVGQEWAISLQEGTIQLVLPKSEMTPWASTDQVGLEASFDLEGGTALEVAVEKDIKLMKARKKTIVRAKP